MKKHITVLFLVFAMVLISCDQDFNTIGSDLVGDEHFDFSSYEAQLKAYSVKTEEVQTNNLPINPLGIYNNPYFGVTKANFEDVSLRIFLFHHTVTKFKSPNYSSYKKHFFITKFYKI